MVVRGDGCEFDARADEKVDEGGLHLRLAGLEVITADEGIVLDCKLDQAGHECVLWRAVDEGCASEDGRDGEDGAGCDFRVTGFNGSEEVGRCVVDAFSEVGVALCVGCPHDDDLVKPVAGFEGLNVRLDFLYMFPAGLGAGQDIVRTLFLICCDEVGVVDALHWLDGTHLLANEVLQTRLEYACAVHSICKIEARDVPSANDEIIGVCHGQKVVEWNVDFIPSRGIDTELDRGAHDDRAVIIGLAGTFTSGPCKVLAVGKDAGSDGGAIVAAQTDHEKTGLGYITSSAEGVASLFGGGLEDAGG